MKTDIRTRADIELLINRFYEKVQQDEQIGYIFTTVIKVNWDTHLPLLYTLWEELLFGSGEFNSRFIPVHRGVHTREPLRPHHFERWKTLFIETINDFFEGKTAELARQKAIAVTNTLQLRLSGGGLSIIGKL